MLAADESALLRKRNRFGGGWSPWLAAASASGAVDVVLARIEDSRALARLLVESCAIDVDVFVEVLPSGPIFMIASKADAPALLYTGLLILTCKR